MGLEEGGGGGERRSLRPRNDTTCKAVKFKGLSVVSLKSFTCEIELVLNSSYLCFSTSV